MFACLCLVSSHAAHPVEALLQLASDFSPRYEMVRPYLVLVEIGGLGRLLGTPHEIGEAFCRVARERALVVSVAIAATHTAARLLALDGTAEAFADPGDAGVLRIVPSGREAAALAALPLARLAMLSDDRLSNDDVAYLRRRLDRDPRATARDGLPGRGAIHSSTAEHQATAGRPATAEHPATTDPRPATSHAAPQARAHITESQGKTRGKRGRGWSQHYRLAPAPLPSPDSLSFPDPSSAPTTVASLDAFNEAWPPEPESEPEPRSPAEERRDEILEVLRGWGLKTLGDFVRLPAADLFERLGRDGIALQQVARGQDARPLVPTPVDEPFEATLALEWPIETLEPLSFVLTRLFEPLCARLERCDRGAAVLEVTLQLVTRQRHTRRLELPAPMRDPKVLRTLILLDLESHPPAAGIDRVTLAIEPTPGRIVQHSLLVRPLPTPEQLSTLLARLTAVMGDGRVGVPALVDTHRPDAFEMRRFEVHERLLPSSRASSDAVSGYVLRRFRRAIPARVTVRADRPVHVAPDGLPAGHVVQAAGPWRTSGEWWKSTPRLQPTTRPADTPRPRPAPSDRTTGAWDRDEWDVALDNGSVYRLHLDHRQARWFLEATLD